MAKSFKNLKGSKFIKMIPDRQARFKQAPAELPAFTDNATALARALHPKRQYLKVADIKVMAEDTEENMAEGEYLVQVVGDTEAKTP